MKFRISKENSEDIDFAGTCVISSIITFEEFKKWLYLIIEQSDQIPEYVYDVLDLNRKFDFTLRSYQILGFDIGYEGTISEENALYGIGYRRNPNYRSDAVSREEALKALVENPHIEKRFREMFPFIDW